MKSACLALLAAAAAACATSPQEPVRTTPGPSTPPGPPTGGDPAHEACPATGDVLIEVAHDKIDGAKAPTSVFKLYANGAYSLVSTNEGGQSGGSSNGCASIAGGDVAKLRAELEAAPWTENHAQVHCMAMGQTFTVFTMHGKPPYTQKICGDAMDDQTAAALADVSKLVDQLTAMHAAPPCCKK